MVDSDYLTALQAWQKNMDDNLRVEDGWLTLVGLHWLQAGENKVGSNPAHPVTLPDGTADTVGTLTLRDGENVVFETAPGISVRIDGEEFSGKLALEPDTTLDPTIIFLGNVSFYIIHRGLLTGVRVKQADSPVRMNFPGREWWPADDSMRVTARINYHDSPKMVHIPDVLGNTTETAMDCTLEFELDGETCQLVVETLSSGQFFIIFHDQSCGSGSYPPGRFLVTEKPEGDLVVIDFNKAYNPPCAFTPYATCPLPPIQNHLMAAIQAGERYFKQQNQD